MSTKDCTGYYHFTSDDEAGLKFLDKVVKKVNTIREDLGSVSQVFAEAVNYYFVVEDQDNFETISETVDIIRSEAIDKDDVNKCDQGAERQYQEAYQSPYRELIQKSDNLIENATSFLVIGFGFNDEHLTPKIKTKVKKGIPIILLTKEVTSNSYEELKDAEKYLLFEESKNDGMTKITYKENNSSDIQKIELEGAFWQLNKFMEIF